MASEIKKLGNGFYNLSDYNENQINFIKSIAKKSYNEGLQRGKFEAVSEIAESCKDFKGAIDSIVDYSKSKQK